MSRAIHPVRIYKVDWRVSISFRHFTEWASLSFVGVPLPCEG